MSNNNGTETVSVTLLRRSWAYLYAQVAIISNMQAVKIYSNKTSSS